ncbi:hypothetical protein [Marinoscillum sp.]|uniref:hypothetical protein n=1 Tax=Marinoscillum sp. TaxID=2024838 RepID=UPI003BA8E1A4
MKKIISYQLACRLLQFIFGLFIIFHLSVIAGIILFDFVPIDYLWGGRLETREALLDFEFISLGVMVLCYLIVLIKTEKVLPHLAGIANIFLWILTVLFLFNTVGNILAETTFEKFFGLVTAAIAILCLRLALEKNESK